MAHSVEVRLPFLFHELVEFVFSLPDEYRINRGWTKYILRQSIDARLPDEIVWRRDKIGYEPPQEEWMRTPQFRELVQEAVTDLRNDQLIVAESPHLDWHYVSLYLAKHALA
jgi:asparagine synthase (glutamine-hydrolysing)